MRPPLAAMIRSTAFWLYTYLRPVKWGTRSGKRIENGSSRSRGGNQKGNEKSESAELTGDGVGHSRWVHDVLVHGHGYTSAQKLGCHPRVFVGNRCSGCISPSLGLPYSSHSPCCHTQKDNGRKALACFHPIKRMALTKLAARNRYIKYQTPHSNGTHPLGSAMGGLTSVMSSRVTEHSSLEWMCLAKGSPSDSCWNACALSGSSRLHPCIMAESAGEVIA